MCAEKRASVEEKRAALFRRVLAPERELSRIREPGRRVKSLLFLWKKGAHAGQLGVISDDMVAAASPAERICLAAVLVEVGKISRAVLIAQEVLESAPESFRAVRYPALTQALWRLRPDLMEGYASEGRILDAFARQGDLFAKITRANAGSIAVVGNSPALLERAEGTEIDAHQMVIRFNNFEIQPAQRAFTGSRTTVWFRSWAYEWLWRRDGIALDLAVLPGIGGFYRQANGQDALIDHALRGQDCAFIPYRVYHDLRKSHGVMAPSLGLLCLSWLSQILGGLEAVDIYGFRLIDQPQFKTRQYFSNAKAQETHAHDWQREYRALCALSPERFKPVKKGRAT